MGYNNLDQGEQQFAGIPASMQKVGRGRRFILQRDGSNPPKIRERRWYDLKKVDADSLRVFKPAAAGQRAGPRSYTRQIASSAARARALNPITRGASFAQQAPARQRRAGRVNFALIANLPPNDPRRKIKIPFGGREETVKVTAFNRGQVTFEFDDGETMTESQATLRDAVPA